MILFEMLLELYTHILLLASFVAICKVSPNDWVIFVEIFNVNMYICMIIKDCIELLQVHDVIMLVECIKY